MTVAGLETVRLEIRIAGHDKAGKDNNEESIRKWGRGKEITKSG